MQGVGKALIAEGHRLAGAMGFSCSVVLGSPDYYGRFGYDRADRYGITSPFEVEERFYMVHPLASTNIPAGSVTYSPAFGI